MEIIHQFTGEAITEGDYQSRAEAVAACIREGKNLYGANIYGANLRGADLSGANLSGADLGRADLGRANLYGANIYGANLRGADLSGANLSGADLGRANLYGANLYGANLYGANLSGANLYRADLYGANLDFRVVAFGPFGTVDQITQFIPCIDKVNSGCWSGTLEEFKSKVSDKFEAGSELRLLFDAGIQLFDAAAEIESRDPKPMTGNEVEHARVSN